MNYGRLLEFLLLECQYTYRSTFDLHVFSPYQFYRKTLCSLQYFRMCMKRHFIELKVPFSKIIFFDNICDLLLLVVLS